jgi:hypothetical protein
VAAEPTFAPFKVIVTPDVAAPLEVPEILYIGALVAAPAKFTLLTGVVLTLAATLEGVNTWPATVGATV